MAKFESEKIASRIVSKAAYENYGIGNPDALRSEFVSTKSEIDKILKLPLSEQAKSLGIPLSQIEHEGLIRIDFQLSPQYKVKIPTGNEWGTNSLWLPGGQLPGGNIEGVIGTKGMKKDIDYVIKYIFK